MKFNAPNILSLIRILIAPVFFFLIISQETLLIKIACILFFFGALTDYFDGWLARKYLDVTEWGTFIDPLADKFLTSAAFLSFVFMDYAKLWMVMIIIGRDIFTTLFRIFSDYFKYPVKTSKAAKTKTFLQMVFIAYILLIIFIKNSSTEASIIETCNIFLKSFANDVMMLFLTMLTIWTAVEYVIRNRMLISKMLKKNEKYLKKCGF